MNLNDHTLKVAVLRVRSDRLKADYEAARMAAEAAYKDAAADGTSQLRPRLPDGRTAGRLSIHAGSAEVRFDEPVLLATVEESAPAEAEDYLEPCAVTDSRVLKLVAEHFPGLVGRRVKQSYRADLAAAIEAAGSDDGMMINEATGALVKVATVIGREPTGKFSYVPGKQGAAAILALLDAGVLTPSGEIAAARDGAE
jgi:hypothetical protein